MNTLKRLIDELIEQNKKLKAENYELAIACAKEALENIELTDENAKLKSDLVKINRRLASYKAVVSKLTAGDAQGANTTVFWVA